MVIHYCWLGRGEKTDKVKQCIESWKRMCPEAEIVEWNEDNYDVQKNAYLRKVYMAKKYSFAADYMRFDILYHQGGVYLDTDVELIKDITPLLESNFLGFKGPDRVNPGLIMYAEKGTPFLKEMLDVYESMRDEEIDFETTIVDLTTAKLVMHGLKTDGSLQEVAGFTIYPTEYFNPKGENYGKDKITENTYSIHHYMATWKSPLDQKIMRYKVKYGVKKGKFLFCLRHPILALKKLRRKNG